ncbi:prenyltransferase/squalene oxidase repeat-containing protein [Micromonospora sp. M61]|uniref:prenyltransferase/squalene oxidase repeat-containing protein n=1 Tax=Micromonospora sp. M61 TaxID=2824890 RepID=UPI001B36B6A7|nr:prenyltransferase/squalene oxidase repeat-containing protein [Micromonospora sp. M61]MBQ0978974.1 prenyltransferase [Micromonospora sp. M61]
MSTEALTRDPGGAKDSGSTRAVDELMAELSRHPSGRTSASPYETARLVSLAPWLPRHADRIQYLLAGQRPDGGWGGPEGYALVPTLSAVEGLLAASLNDEPVGWSPAAVHDAIDRALRLLFDRLAGPSTCPVPDLPAADLIVPAMVDRIADHLADPPTWLAHWRGVGPPPMPAGMDRQRLDRVRLLVGSGRPIPPKLLHALEILGPAARQAAGVTATAAGPVGASPAATAAWLGDPDGTQSGALDYLTRALGEHGGAVPCATPITVFERSWVLSTLARAGVLPTAPAQLVTGLRDALGPDGAATGPGLPTDADTTAVTLYTLALLGHPTDPTCLRRFDTGEHFGTWQGEDGASVTTNAHVLEAFGRCLGGDDPAAAPVLRRLTGWLIDHQHTDGRWTDRWHASPYYATYCVVLALREYGGPSADAALRRAVSWVLENQRADGSWGRWQGTAEETAYGLLVLLAVPPSSTTRDATVAAAHRLSTMQDEAIESPLWHDKDLYHPVLIVRAAVVAARAAAAVRVNGSAHMPASRWTASLE